MCAACLQALPELRPGTCPQCGQSRVGAPGEAAGRCLACLAAPPAFASADAVAAYRGSARELIQLLKYQRVRPLAAYWAERMAAVAVARSLTPDLVVPVPLSRQRQRQRGFNQSQEIGRRLARHLGCGYVGAGLRRRHDTRSQAGLDARARERNLIGTFVASGDAVRGRRVLLVDDVLTTGATARAAAAALIRGGAVAVAVLTAARAEMEMPRVAAAAGGRA